MNKNRLGITFANTYTGNLESLGQQDCEGQRMSREDHIMFANNVLNFDQTKIKQYLFDELSDLRGYIVYDRNHKKIGTISEIYFDRIDLKPRYIEIIPLHQSGSKIYCYPYECTTWQPEGPAFITSTEKDLDLYETYDLEHTLAVGGAALMTYNEYLENDLNFGNGYSNDWYKNYFENYCENYCENGGEKLCA